MKIQAGTICQGMMTEDILWLSDGKQKQLSMLAFYDDDGIYMPVCIDKDEAELKKAIREAKSKLPEKEKYQVVT